MRVAFIHPFLFRVARGIERYTFNLANTLVASVQVDLVTWHWPHPVQIDRLDERVKVHVLPTSRYFAAQAMVPSYAWHLLTQHYDWVWVFFAGYGEAEALTLVRRQRFGVVFHYPYHQVPHRYREFQRHGLIRRAAQLVSVSRFVANGVQECFGRESTVIHHAVDTNRFKPCPDARAKVRAMLGLPMEAPLLVTAAALEERKGVQWVLRALPRLADQFPNVVYLVLGDGSHRPALEKLSDELGIGGRVRFLGAQSDIAPFYQAADLSLILARGEASSLTALESLSCGIPVVAAHQPPFDELLSPDCARLIDESNPAHVSQTVAELLANPAQRQTMGTAGRAHVCADYVLDRVGAQYLRLMRAVD